MGGGKGGSEEKSSRSCRTGADMPGMGFLPRIFLKTISHANSNCNNIQTVYLSDTAKWHKAMLDLWN